MTCDVLPPPSSQSTSRKVAVSGDIILLKVALYCALPIKLHILEAYKKKF